MHSTLPDHPTMTAEEVALVFKVSRDTIYDAVRRGDIHAIRIGRTVRIPTRVVAELLGGEDGSAYAPGWSLS